MRQPVGLSLEWPQAHGAGNCRRAFRQTNAGLGPLGQGQAGGGISAAIAPRPTSDTWREPVALSNRPRSWPQELRLLYRRDLTLLRCLAPTAYLIGPRLRFEFQRVIQFDASARRLLLFHERGWCRN
jgi:hypothetical protein